MYNCPICNITCTTYTSLMRHISVQIKNNNRTTLHTQLRFNTVKDHIRSINPNYELLAIDYSKSRSIYTIKAHDCGHTFTTRSDSIQCNHPDCIFKNRSLGNKRQNTPEVRQKKSTSMKDLYKNNPTLLKQKSDTSKNMWKDDTYRNKIITSDRSKHTTQTWDNKLKHDVYSPQYKDYLSFYQNNDYTILDISNNLIHIKHNICGTDFYLTRTQFTSYYGCPKTECRKSRITNTRKSQQESITKKIINTWNNKLLQEFNSPAMQEHINFYHNNDYSILSIKDNLITLRHNKCGTTQQLSLSQFKAHTNCKHPDCLKERYRQSSWYNSDDFKERMKNKYIEYQTNQPPLCKPSNFSKEVAHWLDSIGVPYQLERLVSYNPYISLDIYIPSKKIAIECNGTYWHSTLRPNTDTRCLRDYDFHKIKSIQAQDLLGVQVYHLFEYDWYLNQDKIKSQLKQLLTKQHRPKIHAKSCYIKNVPFKEAQQFLNNNHIQGMFPSPTELSFGLYLKHQEHNLPKDTLVSIMLFSRSAQSTYRDVEYELTRFASLKDFTVYEAASALFNYFISTYQPNSILSYSDVGKTTGKIYDLLGFKIIDYNEPRYVWTNLTSYYPRRKCQKQYLSKLLDDPGIDLSKTEDQIMVEHGFYKVYDAGLRVHLWTRNT